jgi:hypothetical protein
MDRYNNANDSKVELIQNSSSFYFFYFYTWLDAARRAESEYIY